MVKRQRNSLISMFAVTMIFLVAVLLGGKTVKASDKFFEIPSKLKVYGAVTEETTSVTAQTLDSKDITNLKIFYRNTLGIEKKKELGIYNSYLYVSNGKKVIGKAPFKDCTITVKFPKQKPGTKLSFYFKNGSLKGKTVYKRVISQKEIAPEKVNEQLSQPRILNYYLGSGKVKISAVPGTTLLFRTHLKTLKSVKVPASGILVTTLPQETYGTSIWMYVKNAKGRSDYVQLKNFYYRFCV